MSCAVCGESWWRDAKSWAAWTGNGSRRTEPWVRRVGGDLIGPNPTDSGKAGAKGYDNPSGRDAAARHGRRENIRRIGEEKLNDSGNKRYPARRLAPGR